MNIDLKKSIETLLENLQGEQGTEPIYDSADGYAKKIQTGLDALKTAMQEYGGKLTEQTNWLNTRLDYMKAEGGFASQENIKVIAAELLDANKLASYSLETISLYTKLTKQVELTAGQIGLPGRMNSEDLLKIITANKELAELVQPLRNAVTVQACIYAPLKKSVDAVKHAAGEEEVVFERYTESHKPIAVFAAYKQLS